jgi:hypothetical protein
MTVTALPPVTALPATPDPTHPALRVEYRDSDHSYRVRHDCTTCDSTGRVPGAREGKDKQCPKCKGEGFKMLRTPAVSTILAELNKPALVQWAANMGADRAIAMMEERAGDDAGALVYRSEFDTLRGAIANAHLELKDEAANVGTAVHEWITDNIANILDIRLPEDPALRPACEAFVEWWRESGFVVAGAELIVVDVKERYAGRFDLLVRDGQSRLWVLDIKTSNSIYVEHVLQCSAYATAIRQQYLESIAGTVVVWCHKEGRPVRTVVRTAREYRRDFRVFQALLGIYSHRKTLGGALRSMANASAADAEDARTPVETADENVVPITDVNASPAAESDGWEELFAS